MNSRLFWKIRKQILKLFSGLKKIIFKSYRNLHGLIEKIALYHVVLKNSVYSVFKAIIIILIIRRFDALLLNLEIIPKIDMELFCAVIIGGLGIVGVILGLYCANISSVYTEKYGSAPDLVSEAFRSDEISQHCINSIVSYMIFGFAVIFEILFSPEKISWITVILLFLWTIYVIKTYSMAGNRAYQLADVFTVADDSISALTNTVIRDLLHKKYRDDNTYQDFFRKECERRIQVLKEIQIFAVSKAENTNIAIIGFMRKNLILISLYWNNKCNISGDSSWFRNVGEYRKWHLTSHMETRVSLSTGTSLKPKHRKDYYWFEKELFDINSDCFRSLCKEKNLYSIYRYLESFKELAGIAIKNHQIIYFMNQFRDIEQMLQSQIYEKNTEQSSENLAAGIAELLVVTNLTMVMEARKYVTNINIFDASTNFIACLEKGKNTWGKCNIIDEKDLKLQKQICLEIQVEGERITPDWIIFEHFAKRENEYINTILEAICSGMDQVFNFGKFLYDKQQYFEAWTILERIFEFDSKVNNFISVLKIKDEELSNFHINTDIQWDQLKISEYKDLLESWKKKIPKVLSICAGHIYINAHERQQEYPDVLGESFSHICEDAVKSIGNNNLEQFKIDFRNIVDLMLIYQDYIRGDIQASKDKYRSDYIVQAMISPIIEMAQIAGLAILWGEFIDNRNWLDSVRKITSTLFDSESHDPMLAEKLINIADIRNEISIRGIGHRDIIETEWRQSIERAIRSSSSYKVDYDMFTQVVKTPSEIFNAFARDFPQFGFRDNVDDVFWILIVNPYLDEAKRYRSKYGWEKVL